MQRILCWLGLHRWGEWEVSYVTARVHHHRDCLRCDTRQWDTP